MLLCNGGLVMQEYFYRHYSSSWSDQQKILSESVSLVNGGTKQRLFSNRSHRVEWVSQPQLVLSESEAMILNRFISVYLLPKCASLRE